MVSAIILAAGRGVRMDAATRKQYLHLGGEPIVLRTLRIFDSCSGIGHLILVAPPADTDFCRRLVEGEGRLHTPCRVVAGGEARQESVYRGLLAAEDAGGKEGLVAIHDGVRPLVTSAQIGACIAAARRHGASLLAVPAQDTLKQVDSATGLISGTLARTGVWFAQTPQVFRYDLIRDAHEAAIRDGVAATDDAMLVERIGAPVHVVTGSRLNIKITNPEDLVLAEALLRQAGEVPGNQTGDDLHHRLG